MRTLIIVFAILLTIGAVLLVYAAAPVLASPGRVEYAATLRALDPLLRRVPPDADEVAVIPAGGAACRQLQRHQVTAESFRRLAESHRLGGLPWILGGGPVVVWQGQAGGGGVARVDRLRAILLRMAGSRVGIRVENGLALFGEPGSGYSPPSIRMREHGHLFVIRRAPESVSAVAVAEGIRIRTLFRPSAAEVPRFLGGAVVVPESAMIAAAFATAPELVSRIEQTLPVEISPLLERGGVLALYQLRDERLLPRPRGVIVVPVSDSSFPGVRRRLERLSPELPFGIAGESQRAAAGQTVVRRESIGFTLEYTRRGDELLVAFDKTSVEKFLADRQRVFETGQDSVEWLVRFDPRQLAPALQQVRGHLGMRLLVPELSEGIDRWADMVQWVEGAEEVLAIKRQSGGERVLDVTISPSK